MKNKKLLLLVLPLFVAKADAYSNYPTQNEQANHEYLQKKEASEQKNKNLLLKIVLPVLVGIVLIIGLLWWATGESKEQAIENYHQEVSQIKQKIDSLEAKQLELTAKKYGGDTLKGGINAVTDTVSNFCGAEENFFKFNIDEGKAAQLEQEIKQHDEEVRSLAEKVAKLKATADKYQLEKPNYSDKDILKYLIPNNFKDIIEENL